MDQRPVIVGKMRAGAVAVRTVMTVRGDTRPAAILVIAAGRRMCWPVCCLVSVSTQFAEYLYLAAGFQIVGKPGFSFREQHDHGGAQQEAP